MEGKRAGQKDVNKVGVVEGWDKGGWGRWMGRKRTGQKDGKKVGVVEGWEEGGRGRGM